jgi:hypothetical protein
MMLIETTQPEGFSLQKLFIGEVIFFICPLYVFIMVPIRESHLPQARTWARLSDSVGVLAKCLSVSVSLSVSMSLSVSVSISVSVSVGVSVRVCVLVTASYQCQFQF